MLVRLGDGVPVDRGCFPEAAALPLAAGTGSGVVAAGSNETCTAGTRALADGGGSRAVESVRVETIGAACRRG